jgi:hypothetical protein
MNRLIALSIIALFLVTTGCATQVMHNPKGLDTGEVHVSGETHMFVRKAPVKVAGQVGLGVSKGVEVHGAVGIIPQRQKHPYNDEAPLKSTFWGAGAAFGWELVAERTVKLDLSYLRENAFYSVTIVDVGYKSPSSITDIAHEGTTQRYQAVALLQEQQVKRLQLYYGGGIAYSDHEITRFLQEEVSDSTQDTPPSYLPEQVRYATIMIPVVSG